MKRTFVIISLLLSITGIRAQSNTAFDKFEDYDEVDAVVVNKKAFTMLRKIDAEGEGAEEFKDMVSGLNELKVYSTDDKKVALEMKAAFNKYLKQAGLEELMRVKDEGKNVKIYVKEGADENHVTEFLMSVDGLSDKVMAGESEFVIISITGNIDLNHISTLTDKMNLPAGKQIKKVHGKK